MRNGLILRNAGLEKIQHLDPEGVYMMEMSHVAEGVKEEIEGLMMKGKEEMVAAVVK